MEEKNKTCLGFGVCLETRLTDNNFCLLSSESDCAELLADDSNLITKLLDDPTRLARQSELILWPARHDNIHNLRATDANREREERERNPNTKAYSNPP